MSLRVKRSNPAFLWIAASLALLAMTVFAASLAHAACTNPEGEKGEQVYNATHDTMQFCNGHVWVRMDSAPVEEWTDETTFIHSGTDAVAIGTNTMNPATHKMVVGGRAQAGSWLVEGVNDATTTITKGSSASGVARMTTAQRNGVENPPQGAILFNTDSQTLEMFDGNQWVTMASLTPTYIGAGGGAVYSFTSHTFTNCGATGRDGPSLQQCHNTYTADWSDDPLFFNINTRGYQLWTVPEDGTYRIRAAGARGGYGFNGTAYYGQGRIVEGEVTLNRGDQLLIVVGQMGQDRNGSSAHGGGGGGGSFVALGNDQATASILVVGGGGGGANAYANYGWLGRLSGDGNGFTTNYGDTSRDWSNYRGNGASISVDGMVYANATAGRSKSFRTTGRGGQKVDCYQTYGGFGGGGTPHCHNGGGGGGYHGGAAGHDHRYGGEGGGSYLDATLSNTNNDVGLNNDHGFVTITKLP